MSMKNTMKKMISLLVTLMMLMLSASAMAEEAAPAVEENIVTRAQDLLSQGYALTAEETVKLGSGIDALLSEQDKAILPTIKELLDGLKIRVSGQSVDDLYQFSFGLFFGEDKLGDLILSRNGDVLMVASNFLGQDPIGFTKEDLKKLLYVNVTVEGMEQPVNLADQVVNLIFMDPSSFQVSEETTQAVVKAVEELTNQLIAVIEQNMTISAGETLMIDGSNPEYGMTITLSRDNILELAKSLVTNLGTVTTNVPSEDELKTTIDFLRSDLVLRIYPTDDKTILVVEAAAGPTGEEPVNMHAEYVIDNDKVNVNGLGVFQAEKTGEELIIGGKLNMTDDSTVSFALNMGEAANGKKKTMLDMDGHCAFTVMDNMIGSYTVMNMAMAGAAKMKTVGSGFGKYTDTGVVYSSNSELYIEPNMNEPAFIANETMTIELAEAYLNPESAVMFDLTDEKAQAELTNKISQNATVELMRILTVLPKGIQQLFLGTGF